VDPVWCRRLVSARPLLAAACGSARPRRVPRSGAAALPHSTGWASRTGARRCRRSLSVRVSAKSSVEVGREMVSCALTAAMSWSAPPCSCRRGIHVNLYVYFFDHRLRGLHPGAFIVASVVAVAMWWLSPRRGGGGLPLTQPLLLRLIGTPSPCAYASHTPLSYTQDGGITTARQMQVRGRRGRRVLIRLTADHSTADPRAAVPRLVIAAVALRRAMLMVDTHCMPRGRMSGCDDLAASLPHRVCRSP
jgi:hypothetical protein